MAETVGAVDGEVGWGRQCPEQPFLPLHRLSSPSGASLCSGQLGGIPETGAMPGQDVAAGECGSWLASLGCDLRASLALRFGLQ